MSQRIFILVLHYNSNTDFSNSTVHFLFFSCFIIVLILITFPCIPSSLSILDFHDPWLPSVLLRSGPTTRWLSSPGLVQGRPGLDPLELGLRCLRLRLRLSLILVSLSMGCTCPTRLLSALVHLGPTTPS